MEGRTVVAQYELSQAVSCSALRAFEFMAEPRNLVTLGTARRVDAGVPEVDGARSRQRLVVRERVTILLCCAFEVVVPAEMVADGSALTLEFRSDSNGVDIRHVYSFRADGPGRCLVSDRVEISRAPPCLGGYVTRTARAAHARTLISLARHLSCNPDSDV
jgi:hypothetical protein